MPFSDDSSLTDPSLLGKLCSPGTDGVAWQAFVRRYEPVLTAWCRGLGLQPADAEDVCQAVLLALVRTLPRFRYDRARGPFRGWLKTTLANAVRNFWRSRARRPADRGTGGSDVVEVLAQVETSDSVDSLAEMMDRCLQRDYRLAREAIAVAQAKVKDTTWQAFALTALEGVPATEAAARLGMPVAHVYVHKNRVCKLVRQTVAELRARPAEGSEAVP